MYHKFIHNIIHFNRFILTYENAYFICFLVRKVVAWVIKENLYALQEDL